MGRCSALTARYSVGKLGVEDYARCLLLVTAWREARGDGRDAMRAVAHVIKNRADVWGGGLIHQITSKNQFSSMTVLGDTQTVLWPDATDAVNLADVINRVADNFDPDPTGGALYYANLATENSKWFKEEIIAKPESHPITIVIGKQTFFK